MKRIKKLMKKLNNRGSSVIMVIVALSFVGIIVGALLSAAAYSYRLKIQNYNAKDNFYYVEQAMQEIYAGVGSQTVDNMKEAYNYTLENMVRFDPDHQTYVNLSDEEANQLFKKAFMKRVKENKYFKQSKEAFAESLQSYISNESVKLDPEKLQVESTDDKFVIKNITLTREVEYNNASSGKYTQTISADIEICEPDFEVKFNSIASDYSNIYKYAMVADMGIEINQPAAPVSVNGSIYAASDYYNKSYNDYITGSYEWNNPAGTGENSKIVFNYGTVTSKKYSDAVTTNTLHSRHKDEKDQYYLYDGQYINSMYSGLYIDNTQVQFMSENIIVPGTIAVMNNASISVFYKDGTRPTSSEIWADNLVLDGKSKVSTATLEGKVITSYDGSDAVIRANMFMRDDTELNAPGSVLEIKGGYYGYGNSTSKDTREFIQSVNKANFMVPSYNADGTIKRDASGKVVYENRGHYNSSAIVVNGEKSKLDLKSTQELYLAGRAYIELSKDVVYEEEDVEKQKYITEVYKYSPTHSYKDANGVEYTDFVRDYRTGEGISIKSNQVAYIPVKTTDPLEVKKSAKGTEYLAAKINPGLNDQSFFADFFPDEIFGGYIPVIVETAERSGGTKSYCYYDFATAYDIIMENPTYKAAYTGVYDSADDFTRSFITSYVDELQDPSSTISKYLVDITAYKDFQITELVAPAKVYDPVAGKMVDPVIYSSGAITTKNGTAFEMTTYNKDVITKLLSSYTDVNASDSVVLQSLDYSSDLETEYLYMKWNLGHYQDANAEKTALKAFVSNKGEACVTPINKFFNFGAITPSNRITPSNLKLSSGYKVWVTDEDVVITDEGSIKGIIITKGDVIFELSESGKGTQSFEGLIVAGGKVYINGKLASITSSPEICRSIIKECLQVGDKNCIQVLKVFSEYNKTALEMEKNLGEKPGVEPGEEPGEEETTAKSIDTIDYSDVCSINNWMKNVE